MARRKPRADTGKDDPDSVLSRDPAIRRLYYASPYERAKERAKSKDLRLTTPHHYRAGDFATGRTQDPDSPDRIAERKALQRLLDAELRRLKRKDPKTRATREHELRQNLNRLSLPRRRQPTDRELGA